MSWFKRSPRKNEPHKIQPSPYHSSPMSEKMLEEAKSKGPEINKKGKIKKSVNN